MSMTVVKFLAARLSEEQAMAEEAASGPHDGVLDRDDFGRLLIRPDRVLAQVAAMRAIVEEHDSREVASLERDTWAQSYIVCRRCRVGERQVVAPCPTLRHLAAIWASHPDYDPAWSPDGE